MSEYSASATARLIFWVQERRWRMLAAGFLAGLLAASGQPPFGLFPLGLLGLALGFSLIAAMANARQAAFAGWALGSGYFSGTLIWIVEPFLVDVARHGWMAPFALVFMAGGLALFWGLAAGVAHWLGRGRLIWLAWPVAMGLAELVRGVIFTGFPWGGLASYWLDTPLMGLAGILGASGMGFLTFLAVAGALEVRKPRARRVLWLTAFAACGLVVAGGGFIVDRQIVPERSSLIALRLVQPNAVQHLKWHPDHAETFLERAIDLTSAPPAQGDPAPDLVIWPEASVPFLLDQAGPVLAEIAAEAGAGRVVLGILRSDYPQYYTSLVALDGDGQVDQLYDKHHLVPFGEYIPGGDLLHTIGLKGFAARHGYGYSAGPGPALVDLGTAGKVLPLICYEAIFQRNLRGTPQRPDWIVQITNDAWFGGYSGPQQHLGQARLRAAEFGLPLVRSANTGISAVIDARGRIVARLGLNEAGFLDAKLPGALPATIYARFGDGPLIFLLLGVTLLLVAKRRRNSV